MNRTVGGAWWELDILPGWEWKEDPECLTITKSDEGAFQISASVKTAGAVTGDEINNIVNNNHNQLTTSPTNLGTFKGVETASSKEDVEWLKNLAGQ